MLLRLLNERGPQTTKALVRLTGRHAPELRRSLEKLHAAGFVDIEKLGRARIWDASTSRSISKRVASASNTFRDDAAELTRLDISAKPFIEEEQSTSRSFCPMCGHRVIAAARSSHSAAVRALLLGSSHIGGCSMTCYVGLDVSQKMTAICVVNEGGHKLWRGQCRSIPSEIEASVRRHAGAEARIGLETGPMTPWLVHELRALHLDVVCLDARHARAALKMQLNKNDQNDAEGLAQIMRTGLYRAVHVKSFEAHRARALLGARSRLVGMTTRLSNHIRGCTRRGLSLR